jgi:hypothetical protein
MIKPNKSWGLLGLGVLLGAGTAWAANERYNTAVESIDRANTLLTAIGTGAEKPGAKFQRQRAMKALERAKLRIACAKEIEDSTGKKRGCPAAMKDRFDDNEDDKDDDHRDHDHGRKDGKGDKDRNEKDKNDKRHDQGKSKEKENSEKAKGKN